jgi:thiamine-phosphate pyrophosphorylase
MHARQQSWPRIWLLTDERMNDRLWEAVARLPEGAAIVLRHYSLPARQREELAARLAVEAKHGGITLAVAGDEELARRIGARLLHNPARNNPGLPFSVSVHSIEEAEAARVSGAALVFVSPIYATRSHPGREPLGPELGAEIARAAGVPAIALGGVDASSFAQLEREGFYGWAGIDAWLRT